MAATASAARQSIGRLILPPAVITLAITLLRLAGELRHLSRVWFNPEQGGFLAVVGIVWLVPVFAVYFALKLSSAGQGPPSVGRAIGHAVVGCVVFGLGFYMFQSGVTKGLPGVVVMWSLAALSAAVQFPAWRALFGVLLAYAYAARIPVALVMAAATWGDWQTHYSAAVPGESKLLTYFLFGFVAQLVWWVAFTVVVGSLFGTVTTAVARSRRPATSVSPQA